MKVGTVAKGLVIMALAAIAVFVTSCTDPDNKRPTASLFYDALPQDIYQPPLPPI